MTEPGAVGHRPVLVTGLVRSGTTLLGRALATARNTIYIHEPFNPDSPWNSAFPLPIQNFYIDDHNVSIYVHRFKCLMDLTPIIRGIWQDERRADRYDYINQRVTAWRSPEKLIPIVKDPIALYSAECLVNRFNMLPLISLRDPCDVLSSLIRLQWHKNLSMGWLENQSELNVKMNRISKALDIPLAPRVFDDRDPLSVPIKNLRAGYLICLHYATLGYRMVSYEAFTRDPGALSRLVSYAGLEPSKATESAAHSTTTDSFDPAKPHQNTASPVNVDQIRRMRAEREGKLVDEAMVRREFKDLTSAFGDAIDWPEE